MKAISLWQPWASAIAVGSKRLETRGWPTEYRGPLAIHAAKRQDAARHEFHTRRSLWLEALGVDELWVNELPFGAIIATCELVSCDRQTGYPDSALERELGDYGPGRYNWSLANLKRLPEPIPFKGMQGLFNIPDGLITL